MLLAASLHQTSSSQLHTERPKQGYQLRMRSRESLVRIPFGRQVLHTYVNLWLCTQSCERQPTEHCRRGSECLMGTASDSIFLPAMLACRKGVGLEYNYQHLDLGWTGVSHLNPE